MRGLVGGAPQPFTALSRPPPATPRPLTHPLHTLLESTSTSMVRISSTKGSI